MNYQNELTKMKQSQLKYIYETIQLAGIANETTGNWKSVFVSARNKAISPRVKSLLKAFIDLPNIETAINAFLSAQADFERK